jgi:hypothetical protein
MDFAIWGQTGLRCFRCNKVFGDHNDKPTAELALDHAMINEFGFTKEPNGWYSASLNSDFYSAFGGFVKPEQFMGFKKCRVSKLDEAYKIAFDKTKNTWFLDNEAFYFDREV